MTGLVTMEDLLEKLVGAIEDEFDREEPEIKALSERRFLVAATAQPDSLARALGVVLPEGEYETVAGYLIDRLGKIPPPGTAHRFEDWLILVYDADDRRVRSVTFQYLGMHPLRANRRSEIAL
ncbi:MAG: Hemolysin C [Candidatus Latescibacteria bacterium ADurb.Bin168]|nr:MAG: Hemolysin C [Candidatus Latescibacteria bacterium ADurb.Bin168]